MVNDSLTKIINGVEHEPNWTIHFDKIVKGKRQMRYEMIWVPLTAKRKQEFEEAEAKSRDFKAQAQKKSIPIPTKSKGIPNKYKNGKKK